MKKLSYLIVLLIIIGLSMAGCNLLQTQAPVQNQNINNPTTTTISFLTSSDDYIKYCNGADMDSQGYRKSLMKKETNIINKTDFSQTELITQTVIAASEAADLTTITSNDQNFIKISGDTAYIEPIEGWAGVSIFLCAWQPLVEVNILQFAEIKNIVWVSDQNQWNNLK